MDISSEATQHRLRTPGPGDRKAWPCQALAGKSTAPKTGLGRLLREAWQTDNPASSGEEVPTTLVGKKKGLTEPALLGNDHFYWHSCPTGIWGKSEHRLSSCAIPPRLLTAPLRPGSWERGRKGSRFRAMGQRQHEKDDPQSHYQLVCWVSVHTRQWPRGSPPRGSLNPPDALVQEALILNPISPVSKLRWRHAATLNVTWQETAKTTLPSA